MWWVGIAAVFAFFSAPRKVSVVSAKPSYDDLFKKYGSIYNIDWRMLKAIAWVESKLGTYRGVVDTPEEQAKGLNQADSSDGKSSGLMQVTLTTARDFDKNATFQKLGNPEYSVDIACKYINFTKRYFSVTDPRYTEWLVKSYNQGAGNTLKEKNKTIKSGYANDYWTKYQQAYNMVLRGEI